MKLVLEHDAKQAEQDKKRYAKNPGQCKMGLRDGRRVIVWCDGREVVQRDDKNVFADTGEDVQEYLERVRQKKLAKINRQTAILWTRHRCAEGQQLKITLHLEDEFNGHSAPARVLSVTEQGDDRQQLWRYEVKVRFDVPLRGLDAQLAALRLS